MHLVELAHDQNAILLAIKRKRAAEALRTGLHVSTIINDMTGYMDSTRARSREQIDEATGLSFQELGNALEDTISPQLALIPGWTKPAPRTLCGITGSPDGYSPRARAIDEIKLCWKKETGFVETTARHGEFDELLYGRVIEESVKFTGFRMQILFYMKLWDAIRARLHVLFVAGNYKPPFPKPRTFLLRPTPEEIDDNFDQIRQHAIDEKWLTRSGRVLPRAA